MRGLLYLASTSPRRRELLARAGIEFRLHPPGPECDGSGAPIDRAKMRARSKAVGAPSPEAQGLILGVDTVVAVRGDPVAEGAGDREPVELGKPVDRRAAEAMLWRLSGRDHEVITAHCVVHPATRSVREECVVSRVRCARLTRVQIRDYLDGGDWSDKAGAYGIQSAGAEFMQLVAGDLDTVIGLNLAAVRRLLVTTP